jgi:hypothetical protein
MGTPGVTRGTYLRLFIISPGAFVYRPRVYILVLFETAIEQIHRRYCYKNYFPFLAARTSAAQGVWHFHLSLITLNVFIRESSPISLSRRAVSLTKRKQALVSGQKRFSKNRYNVIKRAGASFHPLNSYS